MIVPIKLTILNTNSCNLSPADIVFKIKLLEGSCLNLRLLLDLNILVLRSFFLDLPHKSCCSVQQAGSHMERRLKLPWCDSSGIGVKGLFLFILSYVTAKQ